MKSRKRSRKRPAKSALSLSLMIGEMALSSMETIGRRTGLIAQGRCSPSEYRRMVQEKAAAAQESALALACSGGKLEPRALLSPWHSRVTANAKRLRRR